MNIENKSLPIDEDLFGKMYSQWETRKIESNSLVYVNKNMFEETVGNANLYSPKNRILRQEIIELENQVMELQGRIDALSGGYGILANSLADTELRAEKKRAIGKYIMIVLEFTQVTMDKLLRLQDIFDKVRAELDKLEQ